MSECCPGSEGSLDSSLGHSRGFRIICVHRLYGRHGLYGEFGLSSQLVRGLASSFIGGQGPQVQRLILYTRGWQQSHFGSFRVTIDALG